MPLPTQTVEFWSVADPDPGSGAFLTPGSGMGKKSWSGPGFRIRDDQPGSYFLELRNHFFGLNYLNSLMRIRDPEWKKSVPGFGMEKSRIWNKHPGSATRHTASRLRPDYLADFLHEKIWRTFYSEVLPEFLAYYFPRFYVQKNILSYLNITNWPILSSQNNSYVSISSYPNPVESGNF